MKFTDKLKNLLKTYRKIAWTVVGVLVIVLPLIFILRRGKTAQAAWYDEGWAYRTPLTFSNSGSADSNKKVLFQIDTATLITAGKLQSSCQDARFTDASGTLLQYYINLSGGGGVQCNDSSSDFYVLMPTIPAGGTGSSDNILIYMYYGNPNASAGTQSSQFSQSTFSPNHGPTTGTETAGPGPLLWWKFDEGQGTTAYDSTLGGYTGTLGADFSANKPTWKTEDQCISGKCLFFDSTVTNDVGIVNPSSSNLTNSTKGTISFWASLTNTNTQEEVVYLGRNDDVNNTDLEIIYDTRASGGSNFEVQLTQDNTAQWDFSVPTSTFNSINETNRWHFYSLTQDGTAPKLYIDGNPVTVTFSVTTNKTKWIKDIFISATHKADLIILGHRDVNNVASRKTNGFVDNFKIYSYARSAAQIKAEYISRGTPIGASAKLGANDQNLSALSNGLVGYWKMDENVSGNSQTLVDSSGNGNNGTTNYGGNHTGMNCTVTGKFGDGCSFDGVDDAVTAGNSSVFDLSASAHYTWAEWIKPSSMVAWASIFNMPANGTTGRIYLYAGTQTDAAYGPVTNGITVVWETSSGGPALSVHSTNNAISTSSFAHVTVTYDGSQTLTSRFIIFVNGVDVTDRSDVFSNGSLANITHGNPSVSIGQDADSPSDVFPGIIDDVRFYNRALSSSEVSQLYNWAPGPVGYWKLEETSGNRNDSSGFGNTLSSNNNVLSSIGKYGNAAAFVSDNNKYLSITNALQTGLNITNPITYSGWIYSTANQFIDYHAISKSHFTTTVASSTQISYLMNFQNGTIPKCQVSPDGTYTNMVTLTSGTNITTNTWAYITCVYNGTQLLVYVNGVLTGSQNYSSGIFSSDGNLEIGGSQYDGGASVLEPWDGNIDEVKVYNYARTPKQIVQDMNGGHPVGGSPVASEYLYWKFDEQNGSGSGAIHDSGFGSTSGNLTGATWKLPNSCKFNGCLSFASNATDNVSGGNITGLDSTPSFSISFWVNPQTLATSKTVVSKSDFSTHTLFAVTTDNSTSSEFRVYIANATNDVSNYFTTSGLGLGTGPWTHIAVVFDGSQAAASRVAVYKNGHPVSGSVTGTIPVVTAGNSSSSFKVGSSDDTTSHKSLGAYIDDVKVYNYPLTQTDVNIDYNHNSIISLGTTDYGQNAVDGAGNPPVGWWRFDDNSGSNVVDSSGNGYTGAWQGTLGGQWAPGKIGSAGHFAYTDNYVKISPQFRALDGQASETVSMWVKPSFPSNASSRPSLYAMAIGGNGPNIIFQDDGSQYAIACQMWNSSGTGISAITNGLGKPTWSANTWHYVTCIHSTSTSEVWWDGQQIVSTNTSGTQHSNGDSYSNIGADNPSFAFTGYIDDVKAYNYARTPAQIAFDYNRGAPVGWWKFDECQGNTTYDYSPNSNNGYNGNNGTLNTDRTVGNCTTGSTMWGDGAIGKFNSSLSFDGTGDYVNVPDNSILRPGNGSWSVSTWAKPQVGDQISAILYKGLTSGSYANFSLSIAADCTALTPGQKLCGAFTEVYNVTYRAAYTTANVLDGSWHMFTAVFNKTTDTATVFVDGKQVPQTQISGGSWPNITGTSDLDIGGVPGVSYWMNGQIDDIRIYNYALSSTQVGQLYNEGSAIRYGPASGTP